MDFAQAQRLLAEISATELVVDVGGGASPFPRANHVIDALPFESGGSGSDGNAHQALEYKPKYTRDTWRQLDLCDHKPWPFDDKFFDFAICSHLLEDVRDPIWVCHELCRIAKAGYVEVPSRVVEQSLGVESPCHAGFYHHRWLINKNGDALEFRHKPHFLHSTKDAIVARLGVRRILNPAHTRLYFTWNDSFQYKEVLQFDEEEVARELCVFATQARRLPDLTLPSHRSLFEQIKLYRYHRRLRKGHR